MAQILVFSEFNHGLPKRVTLEILGKLSGHQVDIAGIGELSADGIKELAKYGAQTIHNIKLQGSNTYSPEGYATALANLIKTIPYDYVMTGSTSLGKDLFPRLATAFQAGLASDLTNFTLDGGNFSGVRPLFSGKCLAKVEIKGPKPHFVSVRPNALGLSANPTAGKGESKDFSVALSNLKSVVKEVIKSTSEKVDLTEANIIVSGGRAMKNADNFKILHELADVLGATVGASRAAVDSGYATPSMQVGQTGKTVSPSLYIACGISGAIQHLAGMRTSKFIVAINTDPEAPIFSKADYGIVGDLFKIVPLMTEEFKKILHK